MSSRSLMIALLVLSAFLLPRTISTAQSESPATLRVVIKPLEPFVMGTGDQVHGFSIDMWREIAERIQVPYEFIEVETVTQQLEAVENGLADVAITGISITAEREERVDFSYPYFNSGLQIMTRMESELSIGQLIGGLLSPSILQLAGVFALVILLGGHLIWLIERRVNPSFPKNYYRGVVEGMWWSSIMVVTGNLAEEAPTTSTTRIISLIWLLVGVLLIANFTASVTAIATINHLGTIIDGVNDLNGRRVATVRGSTGESYLYSIGIQPITVDAVANAYPMLQDKQVDAIVYDSPVLRYYELRGGNGIVKVAGTIFHPEDYGIALPNESPLRENINRAILSIKEDGTYARIYQYWFGAYAG